MKVNNVPKFSQNELNKAVIRMHIKELSRLREKAQEITYSFDPDAEEISHAEISDVWYFILDVLSTLQLEEAHCYGLWKGLYPEEKIDEEN